MTTFIATSPRRPTAIQRGALQQLAKSNPRYWLAWGTPTRNQAAVTLCFDGPREMADKQIVAEFHRLMG